MMRRLIILSALFFVASSTLSLEAHAQTANNPQCFTREECEGAPYYGIAKPSNECINTDQYKFVCETRPKPVTLSVPIGGQTVVVGLERYLLLIYKFMISIVGIVAGIMITIAGFQWLTAAGDSSKIKEARTKIMNALIGLVLALGAYTILYTINPALLQFQVAPIKIMRRDDLSLVNTALDASLNLLRKECTQDSDCNPMNLGYLRCPDVISTSGPTTERLVVPRVCEKDAGQAKGFCRISETGFCRITAYDCGRSLGNLLKEGLWNDPEDLIMGTIEVIKTGGNETTRFQSLLDRKVQLQPGTEGFGGNGFCARTTSCQPTGDFRPANVTIGTPQQYQCVKSQLDSPCADDRNCPEGQRCNGLLGAEGRCRPASEVGSKEPGQPCTADQECKWNATAKSHCNELTRLCSDYGGDSVGTRCMRRYECNSGVCENNSCQPTDRTAQGERRVIEGGACDTNRQCYPGLECIDTATFGIEKRCIPIGGENYPCDNNPSVCGRGFSCKGLFTKTCQVTND